MLIYKLTLTEIYFDVFELSLTFASVMVRAFKYKIKPTVKQQRMLSRFFGCARFIYNWGLARNVEVYKAEKKSLFRTQLSREVTAMKRTAEYAWLGECSRMCITQSLTNLEKALKNFLNGKQGFPKFKSKKFSKDVVKFPERYKLDFGNNRIQIPKIGKVKLCENRTFDTSSCKLGTLTVSRDHCGEYWAVVVVETDEKPKPKAKVSERTSVGIDLGIKSYAILSDGTKYGNPKFLEKGQRRLAFLQKRFAKSQKDSKRHERLRLKIARLHRDIANRRADFLHKLTTMLIERYDTIYIEDLSVKDMQQDNRLANSIHSAAWHEFRRQLEYKAEWHGKTVKPIERFAPSSKTCSKCGYVNSGLTLSVRRWTCPVCGTRHDRDVNAARNILAFGMSKAARNMFPSESGKNTGGEGNARRHPAKRQDCKPA